MVKLELRGKVIGGALAVGGQKLGSILSSNINETKEQREKQNRSKCNNDKKPSLCQNLENVTGEHLLSKEVWKDNHVQWPADLELPWETLCECVLCNPMRLKVSIPHQSELHSSPGAHIAQGY